MKNTRVYLRGFSKHECVEIHEPTLSSAAFAYGQQTRNLTTTILKEKLSAFTGQDIMAQSRELFEQAQNLLNDSVFQIAGKNVLKRYLSMLIHYGKGAGLSTEETVFLQSHADVGCQTVLVRDESAGAASFFHIEENDEDEYLISLHRNKKSQSDASPYRYRVVTWKTNGDHFFFFDYPGLVGPGPAFGINHNTETIIMADTLMPWKNPNKCVLWANAIAFMFADIGNIGEAKEFYRRLSERQFPILGGYAIHMIGKPDIFSFEFSARRMAITRERREAGRTYIAQTNYPLSKKIQNIDVFGHERPSIHDKQARLMVKRRTQRLARIACSLHPTQNDKQNIQDIHAVLAKASGDIETFDAGPVENGLANPTAAAYLAGSVVRSGASLLVGKLSPPHAYPLFYTQNTLASFVSDARWDLRARVVDDLLEGRMPLTVTVLYSLPTKRARTTRFAATDDDTAWVAGKVREALLARGVRATLMPLAEDDVDSIRTIQADCVFNLIEWTGKDIGLSRRVFARLRELNVPVTGATEKNFMQTTDKVAAKKLFLENRIPTPVAQAFITGNEKVARLQFPVIVKPAEEHGSIGLTREAVVSTPSDLKRAVRLQLKRHKQPVLAEEFIDGRELLVYVLEKESQAVVLPIEEISFVEDESLRFQTYESKWDPHHPDYENTKVTIAKLTARERRKVERVCKRLFRKLGFRGYARFDIRLKNDVPYVLEANANPNIYDSDEDQIPGIGFPDFCWEVVANALREYKKGWHI